MIQVELVTADGQILVVNENEHPGIFFPYLRPPPSVADFGLRSLVGLARCRSCPRRRDALQSKGLPGSVGAPNQPSLL